MIHGSASFVGFRKKEIEGSIPSRFERSAVRAGGTDLTYRALNDAADRTARALLSEHGPAPDRVALLFDRDPGLITTAFGVLKAGKVWVPLDQLSDEEAERLLAAELRNHTP